MPSNRRGIAAFIALTIATALWTRARGWREAAAATRTVAVPNAQPWEWTPAEPATQGIDATPLAEVLAAGRAVSALRSLLVVRNGRLIGERYYGGATADDLQALNSVTKSVVSLLVGQALQRGLLPGLSATAGSLLPGAAAAMPGSPTAKVTLAQILCGRTGLQYDWLARYDELMATPDLVRMAFGLAADPAVPPPWTYNDPAIGLISPIFARAAGEDIADFAARELFAPLGIARYAWARDRSGRSTSFAGLALRPRDLMKLLWLLAEGGTWEGRARVPADWIEASTRPHGEAGWRVAPVTDIGYGLLWFTGLLHGQRVVWGWGYGGQFALWAPGLRLAVATSATSPAPDAVAAQTAAVMRLVARVVKAATV